MVVILDGADFVEGKGVARAISALIKRLSATVARSAVLRTTGAVIELMGWVYIACHPHLARALVNKRNGASLGDGDACGAKTICRIYNGC